MSADQPPPPRARALGCKGVEPLGQRGECRDRLVGAGDRLSRLSLIAAWDYFSNTVPPRMKYVEFIKDVVADNLYLVVLLLTPDGRAASRKTIAPSRTESLRARRSRRRSSAHRAGDRADQGARRRGGLAEALRRLAPRRSAPSVMPEQRQQDDDRDRNPEQPQQYSSAKAHDDLLSSSFAVNAQEAKRFRAITLLKSTRRNSPRRFSSPHRRLSPVRPHDGGSSGWRAPGRRSTPPALRRGRRSHRPWKESRTW